MALALRLSTYLRRTSVSVNKTAAEAAAMKDINRAIAIENELAARSQLRIGLSAIVDRSESTKFFRATVAVCNGIPVPDTIA